MVYVKGFGKCAADNKSSKCDLFSSPPLGVLPHSSPIGWIRSIPFYMYVNQSPGSHSPNGGAERTHYKVSQSAQMPTTLTSDSGQSCCVCPTPGNSHTANSGHPATWRNSGICDQPPQLRFPKRGPLMGNNTYVRKSRNLLFPSKDFQNKRLQLLLTTQAGCLSKQTKIIGFLYIFV